MPVNGAVNRGFYDGMLPDQMLAVDAMGIEDVAVLGDMMFARIGARKATGIVVGGAIRDAGGVSRNALPIFARINRSVRARPIIVPEMGVIGESPRMTVRDTPQIRRISAESAVDTRRSFDNCSGGGSSSIIQAQRY